MREVVFICVAATGGAICLGAVLWCEFMLRRNNWVFRRRMDLLENDYPCYLTLPSYDHMMKRWWVWNLEAFLPGGRHHAARLARKDVKRLRQPHKEAA